MMRMMRRNAYSSIGSSTILSDGRRRRIGAVSYYSNNVVVSRSRGRDEASLGGAARIVRQQPQQQPTTTSGFSSSVQWWASSSPSLSTLSSGTNTSTTSAEKGRVPAVYNDGNQTAPDDELDVLIVGGGVVGAALARLLRRLPHPLRIGLVEAGPGPLMEDNGTKEKGTTTSAAPADATIRSRIPHPRSYALSPASLRLLGIHRGRDEVLPGGWYQSMQVWEAQQPATLLWSSRDLPAPTTNSSKNNTTTTATNDTADYDYLGCCIEDSVLTEHLWKEILETNDDDNSNPISVFRNTVLQNIQWPTSAAANAAWVQGTLVPTPSRKGTPSAVVDEKTTAATTPHHRQPIRTRLLVAADGAHSRIRQQAGIAMATQQYGQTALTCTVELAASMRGRAFQRFLGGDDGPLALLPTFSDRHAVVVWSTTPEQAAAWSDPDNTSDATIRLTDHLNRLLQNGPEQLAPLLHSDNNNSWNDPWNDLLHGVDKLVDTVQYGLAMAAQQQVWDDDSGVVFTAPPLITDVASPRIMTFPLQCQWPAQQQYCRGTHLALVGDAAHSVHPLAGQGLNLGLQDVAALVAAVEKAVGSGMDVGTFLPTEFQAGRQTQVTLTVAGIHGLQRLFVGGGQSVWGKHLRSLGMSALQTVGPARRAVVQAATQGVAVP